MIDLSVHKEEKQQDFFSIAGLTLSVSYPPSLQRSEILPSFEHFYVQNFEVSEPICTIELSYETPSENRATFEMLSDVSLQWAERFCFYQYQNYYMTTIENSNFDGTFLMKSSKNFKSSIIYLPQVENETSEVLSWYIMMAFGQACLAHRTVLMHASVIEYEGTGYAFLGKSGTGKSTHSSLWLEEFPVATLLNDDNPAIRIFEDGRTHVFGTPWSGKTPCFRNIGVLLQGIVRLNQAPENKFYPLSGLDAFVCILPSCTAIRWNKTLFTEMSSTVEAIANKVLVSEFQCQPNRQAARMCYNELIRNLHEPASYNKIENNETEV